jgi:hypothetical protein
LICTGVVKKIFESEAEYKRKLESPDRKAGRCKE